MEIPRLGYVVLVDGLRHDYVTPEAMPFLYQIKQRSRHATVIETVAFQTRPAYFAGLEPEESDVCHLFSYEPAHSPFRWLRPFSGCLRGLDRLGRCGLLRRIITRLARAQARRAGTPAIADVLSTENVPLELLPLFSLSEERYTDEANALPKPTFFDALRQQGLSWCWVGYPRHTGDTASIRRVYQESPESDVVYLHLSELDWLGHRYGPDSPEMQVGRRVMDESLRQLLEPGLEENRRLVLFGDHGMVRVEYALDIQASLGTLPLQLGRDYLVFLDSTQARFWYFNDEARTLIEGVLADCRGGHFITPKERSELGLRFSSRRYGDALFVLDGPGIIHPSFFSAAHPPRGMHGYLPHVLDNRTQVMATNVKNIGEDLGTVKMTEIYRMLLETFELEAA